MSATEILSLTTKVLVVLVKIISDAMRNDPVPTTEELRKRLVDAIENLDDAWLEAAKSEAEEVFLSEIPPIEDDPE